MSVIRTIIALGSAVSAIMVAYFFGHALSSGEASWYLASGVAALVSAALVFGQVRMGRGQEPTHG